jgi:spore germination protein PE
MTNTYPIRTSNVGAVCLIDVSIAGVVQFGDRAETNARLKALAVQRQEDHKTAGDVFFESYDMFYQPRPVLNDPDFDNGQVIQFSRNNCCPNITVGFIHVIATGASSSILIGNGMCLDNESRIKHIRQYARRKAFPPIGC